MSAGTLVNREVEQQAQQLPQRDPDVPRVADRTPPPLIAAAASTVISLTVVVTSILITGRLRGFFLIWNLLLAWLPMLFALLASRPAIARRSRWVWSILWLLFFPNAPYIFTDLVHVGPRYEPDFWIELGVVLLFALTALVVGYLSLDRMQRLVARYYGWWAGWCVVLACTLAGSLGVAIGRFLRWNSWDALTRPVTLITALIDWLAALPGDPGTVIFLGLFTLFLFLGYLMFHSMGSYGLGLK